MIDNRHTIYINKALEEHIGQYSGSISGRLGRTAERYDELIVKAMSSVVRKISINEIYIFENEMNKYIRENSLAKMKFIKELHQNPEKKFNLELANKIKELDIFELIALFEIIKR